MLAVNKTDNFFAFFLRVTGKMIIFAALFKNKMKMNNVFRLRALGLLVLSALFTLSAGASSHVAADGNGKIRDYSTFTAQTIEGVDMEFYVEEAITGECGVGKPKYVSIPKNTTGEITIPSEVEGFRVTKINLQAFQGCAGITSVNIPSSVTSIGSSAFADCVSLTSVSLGDGVKTMGDFVFDGCTSLTTITGFSQLERIGYDAFRGEGYGSYIPWYDNQPDGLLYLGNVLYKYIGTMPDHTAVDVKEGTTQIADECFCYCMGLTSLTVPQSLNSVEGFALSGCNNLASITVASGNGVYDSRDNCNAIVESETNTVIAGCKNTIIPNTATAISMYAFTGSVPEEVVIPNSVDSIDYSAFYFCEDLKSVAIGEGTRIIQRSDWDGHAFIFCPNLQSITVAPANPYLDSRDNCNAIIDKATDRLIVGCPATVIPQTVSTIGSEAFEYYDGIFSVTIPDQVETIEYRAFASVSDLETLVLGQNLMEVGREAFSECTNLQAIYSLAYIPAEMDESAFSAASYKKAVLYVPEGSKQIYMNSQGWRKFKHIEEFDISDIDAVATEKHRSTDVFSLSGKRLSAPKKGINIIGGRKVIVR